MPVTINGNGEITGIVVPGVEPGTIGWFAYDKPPKGWLECNGQSVPALKYPSLFESIGNTFGGDETDFNVPDMRGYFIRGWDDGRGVDPGRVFGSLQDDAFESHGHSANVSDPGHTHTSTIEEDGRATYGLGAQVNGVTGQSYAIGQGCLVEPKGTGIGVSVGAAGGTETRPKNIALLPCIKV